MTDSMAENYHKLKLIEDSIWKCIKYAEREGKTLKEMDRLFNISEHFNPTRTNVVPDIQIFKFGSWKSQKSIIGMDNQSTIDSINSDWDNLLKDYASQEEEHPNFVHKVYKNVNFDDVYEKIIKKHYSNEDIRLDTKYIKSALGYLKINDLKPLIDIYIMRDKTKSGGHGEERHIFEDKTISNIMQGRNRNEGDPEYYPGDDKLNLENYQIQIHAVYNNEYQLQNIPVISFYAPNNTIRMVGKIV